jgi:hypothetical protein
MHTLANAGAGCKQKSNATAAAVPSLGDTCIPMAQA